MARGAGGKNEFLGSSKIMSRQSSMSVSSRIYYRSSGAAGFPFTWEMLPGEPKDKPANDGEIPPLSPPPALQSLSLPKPSVEDYFENKKSSKPSKLLLKLWKKMGKKIKKSQNKTFYISSDQCGNNDVDLDTLFDEVELGSSVDSSSYSKPPRKAMSTSSCSLSSCSSSSSTMEDKNSNVARADEDVSSRKPFSWSISRMVVACASGSKRV